MRPGLFTVGLLASAGLSTAAAAQAPAPSLSLDLDVTAPAQPAAPPPLPALLGSADTASQGYVTAEQVQTKPVYRVGEVLENVPGLIVAQHSGEGKANQYFLRGFDLDHGTDIAISLDDMPVNMRTHAHGQGYSDLNFMIPELVRDIRYSKGPYFAELGDFDTAGAVQIDYLDALPHDLASISAGTLGHYRGFAAMSRPWNAGNLLAAAEYVHADGPWLIPDNFNKGNAVLRYSQGNAENGLSLSAMYMQDAFHATNQIPQRAVETGLLSPYAAIDPTDSGKSQRYSLSAKYAVNTGVGQLKANVYLIGYSLTLLNNFDYFASFPPPIGDQFRQTDRRKIYGGNVSYTVPGTLFGAPSQNTIGFQTRTDNIHVGLDETTAGTVRFTVRDDHAIESSGGFYVENRTRWADKLRTLFGLREDVYYGSDTSSLSANSGSIVRSIASPKGNLILGPWAETEYYLSAGQGFHSDDLRGAVSRADAFATALNRLSGTPGVIAQDRTPLLTKATGYEIGLRSQAIPAVKLDAALFVLDLDSEATFSGDEAGTTPGRASRRVGLEINGAYRATPWLTLDGSFAFTRARYTDPDAATNDTVPGHPGNHIPGAAKLIASGGATLADLGPWSGALRFRYFGRRPLTEDNSVTSRPTALFDAQLTYALSERAKLRLDIFNLFNSRTHQIDYYYPSRLAAEAAPVFDIHYKPVEPLSARVSFNAAF